MGNRGPMEWNFPHFNHFMPQIFFHIRQGIYPLKPMWGLSEANRDLSDTILIQLNCQNDLNQEINSQVDKWSISMNVMTYRIKLINQFLPSRRIKSAYFSVTVRNNI